MTNFLLKEEKKISHEFLKKGYVIKKIKDKKVGFLTPHP